MVSKTEAALKRVRRRIGQQMHVYEGQKGRDTKVYGMWLGLTIANSMIGTELHKVKEDKHDEG